MRRLNPKFLFPVFLMLFFAATLVYAAQGFSFITKDQLKKELGNRKVTIIDVRTRHDWNSSHWKIEGAQRRSPKNPWKWMSEYPKNRTIVLYCA